MSKTYLKEFEELYPILLPLDAMEAEVAGFEIDLEERKRKLLHPDN